MDRALRTKLIRLAHAKPELQAEILPLLGQPKLAGCEKLPEALRENCEKKQDEGKESDKKASQRKQAMKGYPTPAEGPQAVAKFIEGFAKELDGPELAKALGTKPKHHIKGNHISFEMRSPDGGTSTCSVWFDRDGMPTLEGFVHGVRVKKSFAHMGQTADAVAKAIVKFIGETASHGKTASQRKKAHGAVALRNPQVMLYVIDPADNKSKFYEMAVVPQGDESPAMKSKDFSRGAGGWVLMKRWGRLTDKGGVTGRVDSMNEIYADQAAALTMMAIHKDKKIRGSGYTDVSRTKTYPIGLGSAGFGWGGQAACAYVPELKQLASLVNKSKADLMGMASTLNALERRNSGMAKQISVLYVDAMGSLGKLDTYLEGQLASC